MTDFALHLAADDERLGEERQPMGLGAHHLLAFVVQLDPGLDVVVVSDGRRAFIRSRHGAISDSRMMRPETFDCPRVRSRKRIGDSTIRRPARAAVYVISTWKPWPRERTRSS